jgi:hypothetical protein
MKSIHTKSYEHDFFKWTKQQALLLKNREFEKIDIDNLREEIESLGKSEKRALNSHLINLLMHLLKIEYQKEKHTSSWDQSISNARTEIMLLLKDSPSLKNEMKKIFKDSYQYARNKASQETGLEINVFPETCPWEISDIYTFSDAKDVVFKKHSQLFKNLADK